MTPLSFFYGMASKAYNMATGGGGANDITSAEVLLRTPRLNRSALYAANQLGWVRRLAGTLPSWALAHTPQVKLEAPDLADKLRRRSEELRAWSTLTQAAAEAELTGLGAVYLGTLTADQTQPLNPGERIGKLHALSRWQAVPVKTSIDLNVASPTAGLPLFWKVYPFATEPNKWLHVHVSRLVLVKTAPPTLDRDNLNDAIGDGLDPIAYPLAERIYGELMNLEIAGRECRRLRQLIGSKVLKVPSSLEEIAMLKNGNDAASGLIQGVNRLLSSMALGVIPADASIDLLGPPLAGIGDLDRRDTLALCLALGWPEEIVSGKIVGGLGDNSQGLRISFGGQVTSYARAQLTDPVEALLDALLADAGAPGADFSFEALQ